MTRKQIINRILSEKYNPTHKCTAVGLYLKQKFGK